MNHLELQYKHRNAVANQPNQNDVNNISVVKPVGTHRTTEMHEFATFLPFTVGSTF